MSKDQDEKEVERRRDEALRRALSTPPKPHTPKSEAQKSEKPKRKKKQ